MALPTSGLRGVNSIVAATFVSEVGDIDRFDNPRQLMGYLGLVPSERSTGDTVRRGGITKAGNRRVRHMLVESAWTYRHPPRLGAQGAGAAHRRAGAAGLDQRSVRRPDSPPAAGALPR
jgi:transposase